MAGRDRQESVQKNSSGSWIRERVLCTFSKICWELRSFKGIMTGAKCDAMRGRWLDHTRERLKNKIRILVDSLTHRFAAGHGRKACDEAVSRNAGSAIGSHQCLLSHSQSISNTWVSLSASIQFYKLDVWLPSDSADDLHAGVASKSDRLQISTECNGKSVRITRDEARMRAVCIE